VGRVGHQPVLRLAGAPELPGRVRHHPAQRGDLVVALGRRRGRLEVPLAQRRHVAGERVHPPRQAPRVERLEQEQPQAERERHREPGPAERVHGLVQALQRGGELERPARAVRARDRHGEHAVAPGVRGAPARGEPRLRPEAVR
jgi:hypothetical protein